MLVAVYKLIKQPKKGVQMQYLIPSIVSLDSSRMHLFRNQATCDPTTILNGQELIISDFPSCGEADISDSNVVEICLSGPVNDITQLNGLVLTASSSNQQITIDSCVDFGTSIPCSGTAYRCTAVGGLSQSSRCILNIQCPDGTIITECSTQNCTSPA
jgi:hypothetical protein